MLKLALLFEDELIDKFRETWFQDKYIYYHNGAWHMDMGLATDTQTEHQFVSYVDDEVIGYIGYSIDRDANAVNNLCMINFSDNKLTFGKDAMEAIDDIFCRFNFNKITFEVVIGNPAEKTYDKFIKMTGGRVVGTYKQHTKLQNGKFYDMKLYELLKEDYIKHRKKFFDYD